MSVLSVTTVKISSKKNKQTTPHIYIYGFMLLEEGNFAKLIYLQNESIFSYCMYQQVSYTFVYLWSDCIILKCLF